jgi:glycosyltransferase involved in cell wall biosynthesis
MSANVKVFILSDWFAPGYRAGGPITSLYRMCGQLNQDVEFFILTNNHDWHQAVPYDLPSEQWTDYEGVKVFYTSEMRLGLLDDLLDDVQPDLLYWNGIYSPRFHALPLIKYLIRPKVKRMIVAPRGMLNANAIALKSTKKTFLLGTLKALGIAKKVNFHATSFKESQSIQAVFPDATIKNLSNLPPVIAKGRAEKADSRVGFISVGRISRVKNTLELLRILYQMNQTVTLIGGFDDPAYFEECHTLITASDQINWIEGVAPDRMESVLLQHRFFLSMTTGENFGHAIIEALAAGCPVIISDHTPWNDLEEYGAGWVLPLNDQQAWIDCINECKNMDDETYRIHSERARSYVSSKFDQAALREQYIKLFTGED